MATKHIKVWVI